jgi:hypothetical protein
MSRHTDRLAKPFQALRRASLALVPLALALSACAGTAPPQGSGDSIEEIARSSAIAAGLTPVRISVEAERVTRSDGDREIQGYLAWMDVEECPEGKAVVRLTEGGYVQDIFGKFGCTVP